MSGRATRPPAAPSPLVVAVVASWFPSMVNPTAGRFIADQAAALYASGRARPTVVSFDPAFMSGSGRLRSRLAAAVVDDACTAVREADDVFSPAGLAGGPSDVPVARLPIPEGRTGVDPVLHALHHRQVVLEALADRWTIRSKVGSSLPPRPALVHAHTGYPDGAAAVALADRLQAPLLVTEHVSFLAQLLAQPQVRAAYLRAARQAFRMVVVSDALALRLRQAMPEIAERVVVVPNTVSVDDFIVVPLADRRADELLYVGERTEAKGVPLLLAALARVRERRPGVTLRLIGQAPHAALDVRWQQLAARLGVAGAVTFEPPADRRGVAAAMARASVFLHGSRSETFGVVAAEALAAGLPVVATDSGGVTEILGPDPAALGALVPTDNVAAMTSAISDVLDRRATFDPERARASVRRRYGAAAVADQLVAIYEAAIEAHGRPTDRPGHGRRRAAVGRPVPAAAPLDPTPPVHVLLALDPDRARLAERLPAAVRGRLVVVTSAARDGPQRSAFGDVVTVALGRRARTTADAAALASTPLGRSRLGAGLRHPLALARRRGLFPGTEHLVRTRGRAGLRAALERAGKMGDAHGASTTVICVDGFDHLVAGDLAGTGEVVVAPGGIRWLGDRVAPEALDRPATGVPATLRPRTDRTGGRG
jgi:glycosyltransferase involved in cell wall biosynthesis